LNIQEVFGGALDDRELLSIGEGIERQYQSGLFPMQDLAGFGIDDKGFVLRTEKTLALITDSMKNVMSLLAAKLSVS
jgi:hypothetical protein